MDVIRQDLIFALRLLRKERAYVTAVVLTLGLCLGANAAIFAVVQAVLLRPCPIRRRPARLQLRQLPGAGVERAGTSVPNHFDRVKMLTPSTRWRCIASAVPTSAKPARPSTSNRAK